jgi:hypothetical protein
MSNESYRNYICKTNCRTLSSTIRQHRDRQESWSNKKSFHGRKSFCTCSASGNQVDGLALAPRKDAASASWLSSGRASMCKTRRVFPSSEDVSGANVLGNIILQILSILRLRLELVNDRNARTRKKFYSAEILKN